MFFRTIKDLPLGIWDKYICRGNISLDSRLIELAERSYPNNKFYYWVEGRGNEIDSIFFLMVQNDIVEEIDKQERVYGYSATPETSGVHFYFNDRKHSFDSFIKHAKECVKRDVTDVEFIILQDFLEDNILFKDIENIKECQILELFDVSLIKLDSVPDSLEGYMATLPSKSRNEWKKAINSLDRDRYKIEVCNDYVDKVDLFYPLYVSVAKRAAEYNAEPHSISFFTNVKEIFKNDATFVAIFDTYEECYIGFMLLIFNGDSCLHYYIGFEQNNSLYLWHNLTIECLREGFLRGCTIVDMGVTNAVGKRKFGAKTYKSIGAAINCSNF